MGGSSTSLSVRDDAPTDVPVYPVLRLELRQDCDQWVAVLNGEVVGRCGNEEGKGSARALLVKAATLVAARRPGGAIRARLGAGFDPAEVAGVVTADGRLIVQDDVAAPVRRRGPRRVLLLGAVAVATAAVTATGVVVHSAHPFAGSPRVAIATPPPAVQLPVLAPVGWSSVAAWSLPLPSQSAAASVSTDGQLVFAPSAAGDVVVGVDAGSGVRRWSAPVGGPLVGGPVVARPGAGSPVVVVWTRDHLVTLEPATGAELGSWELDTSLARVAVVGGGVVASGQGQHAQVFDGSHLVSRVVPAGGSVVGVHGGAMVVAGNGDAWLVTSASVAGDGAALSAPAGTAWAGPVGVVGDDLVCAFGSPDSSGVLLRAFEIGTWKPLWTTAALSGGEGISSGTTGASPSLVVAPDDSWGIVARTVIDFRTGATYALPSDWATSAVGRTLGFGATNGRVVSVT